MLTAGAAAPAVKPPAPAVDLKNVPLRGPGVVLVSVEIYTFHAGGSVMK